MLSGIGVAGAAGAAGARRWPGFLRGRWGGAITDPAWRARPSWYLVTTDDKMIPPPAQRTMSARAGSTVTEVAASHSVYISQPAAVAALIKQAVSAVAARQ